MISRYKPELKNLLQIRASVITKWLKHYNQPGGVHGLRETKYMAKHKYVSSTERYKTDNLENLQKDLRNIIR